MGKRFFLGVSIFFFVSSVAFGWGVNVKDFGAKGDGKTDDTKAIRAALDAAAKRGRSRQYPGSAYYSTSPEVFFPSGHYIITEALPPSADTIRGEGHAVIEQKNPDKDIFYTDYAWRVAFKNLIFLGGRTHLNLGNPNIDSGFILIENCKFQMSRGPAIQVREGSNSTFTIIQNCQFIGCDQVLITYTDWTTMKDCWISGGAKQENEAMIENRGAKMVLEDIVGVPNVKGLDQRWIDNYGSLTCKDFRFGGEGAGFTPVVNFAKYSRQLGGPTVVLEDCWVSALGNPRRLAAIYCEEIPNLIEVRNCNLAGVPAIEISKKIDLKNYFKNVKPGMLQFKLVNNIGEFAGQIPELLRNPVIVEDKSTRVFQLSEDETRKALAAAVAYQKSRPPVKEEPGEYKGHKQKTDPSEYMEITFDKYEWDLDDYMDGTSDKNSKYLAVAPVGDDVIIMRRIEPRDNWPHVLIRDVTIDLDKYPYLTWKQKDPGNEGKTVAFSYAIKVIDKETQTMLTLIETSGDRRFAYGAYNLKKNLGLGGKRTFDIKYYYLATQYVGATKDRPFSVIRTEPGGYMLLDFIRAEAE